MDAELETRLRDLLDKQAIHEVMLRYCRGIDHRDDDLVRSTYHPDAFDDHGSFVGGIEDLIVANRTERPGWVTRTSTHMIGNCLIELAGDEAYVETYFLVHKPLTVDGVEHIRVRAGRYLDLFERRNEEWRIKRRTVVDDFNRLDLAPEPPEGHTPGRFSLDDPVYAFLAQRVG
jgi:SnoaL-like domain